MRVTAGLSVSRADEGFATLLGGVEFRPIPRAWLAPFGAVYVGLLGEPEYGGTSASVSVGVLVAPVDRITLVGAISRGGHGGESGPHSVQVGVEWGIGRSAGDPRGGTAR